MKKGGPEGMEHEMTEKMMKDGYMKEKKKGKKKGKGC